MVTNEEKKIVASKVEEYNNLIERAVPLMQEKQGIFNQLFYLNHIESVAPERVDYLESAKRRYSAEIERLENFPLLVDAEERRCLGFKLQNLKCKLKVIDENLEGFKKMPEVNEKRRAELKSRFNDIQDELAIIAERLNEIGVGLDRFYDKRTYKGRGLTSPEEETVKVISEGLRRYKLKEENLNFSDEEEM